MNNDEDILKDAIRLYINGKNICNSSNNEVDKVKAKDYFKKSLEILNELKKLNNSNYNQIIQTTEAECIKLLNTNDNIFELIRKNDLNSIKNIEYINFREIDSNGNTVLHHAIDVGDIGILKEILKKGGMIDTVNGNGHTLLEYACLKKDPNIISFIISHGANMQKHLFFRKGDKRYYLNKSDIDLAILLKLIIINSFNKTEYTNFSFLNKYFNINELVGIDKYTIKDIMIGLHSMFNGKESYHSYRMILDEDLTEFDIYKNINKCIYTKLDLLLSNLVPFINYPFNIASIFVLKNEIKIMMKNILKNNKKDFKNILMTELFEAYIQPKLFPEDYIGIIVYNILSKINIK
jgi:hypothetical protein